MWKRSGSAIVALAVLVSQSACYTTRIVTDARPSGPEISDRQWFTLAGLVNVSPPAGRECRQGVSYAESKLSGVDWLINVGLGLAGGVAGALACSGSGDQAQQSYCATAGAAILPFLLSSRTVNYACAEGGAGGAAYMPAPQGEVHRASPVTP